MTSDDDWQKNELLMGLRRACEARGYEFFVDPPQVIVPAFLGDFRPDAIARGPRGGIVIQVKRDRDGISVPSLAEITKLVSAQGGWEFRVVVLNPRTDRKLTIGRPTPEQIDRSLADIEALTESGHNGPALLAAWAVVEALARLTSSGSTEPFEEPLQAVQALAEDGYLQNDDVYRLRSSLKFRDAVAHGDLTVDVSTREMGGVLALLRSISSNIQAVHA